MPVTPILSALILAGFLFIIGKLIFDIKFGHKEPRQIYIGDLQLVYRQGQPFFRQYHYFSKSVRISFGKDQAHLLLHYGLTLEEGYYGGQVRLGDLKPAPGRVGVLFYKNMIRLVDQINRTIQDSQGLNLGETISQWEAFQKTDFSACQIQLLPPIEDISPNPGWAKQAVRLAYQNDQPIFWQGNSGGHQLVYHSVNAGWTILESR